MEFLLTLKLFFAQLIQWLHLNPGWAGFVTFLIALSESLAVIGLLIPGTVIMAAIGTLIGANIIPVWTIAWAIAGAIVGDSLSYHLGYHFNDRLREIWPFKRYPQLLTKGERFFADHGGKSVFLGRFIGPIRPIIPVIAGMLNMRTRRFLLSNVCSAVLWAPAYMLPGLLIGAASLELDPKTAGHFLVGLVAVLLLICLTAWFFQYVSRCFLRIIDKNMSRFWQKLQDNPSSQSFCRWISNPQNPHSHGQLSLLITAFILLLLLISLVLCTLYYPILTNANHAVHYFFRSIQGTTFTQFFVSITLLGFRYTLIPITLIIGISCLFYKPARVSFFFLIGVVLSTGIIVTLSKMLLISPRPNDLPGFVSANSFPSGHTAASVALYASLAVIIHPLLKSQGARHFSTVVVCLLCLLIAISRLYLAVHWSTDIIAGLLLGGFFVAVGTLLYRRYPTPNIAIKPFLTIFFVSLLIAWLTIMHLYFEKLTNKYTAYWPSSTMTLEQWWQQSSPVYLYSRTGKPIKLFNIQWLDSMENIKKALQKNGWAPVPKLTLTSTINRISSPNQTQRLPLTPKVFAGKKPVLFMYKSLEEQKGLLVLQLWRANIQLSNHKLPLWFGLVTYKLPHAHNVWKRHQLSRLKKKLPPATLYTAPLLDQFHWRRVCYPNNLRPQKIISRKQWKNGVLLLAPKNARLSEMSNC